MDKDKKLVLIVEDDLGLEKILADKLSAAGLNVDSATTAQMALTKVKEKIPSLILLDIMLPGGMNGFDALEQLKKNPAYKDIPVIVLTNLDTEQKTAMDIGATDYIVKTNISLDEVVQKIQANLR